MSQPSQTARRSRRWAAAGTALAAAALSSSVGLAVSTTTAPAAASDGEEAVVRVASAAPVVDTFNPFVSIYLTPISINRMVYENLVAYGTNNEAVPGLAQEWETSEDGLTWTFTIGEDRMWSDGEPVTSDDVAWTLQAILDDPNGLGANSSLVANIDAVETPDEQTVVMELKEAQAANPGFEIPIVPEHVWSEVDDPSEFNPDADVVGSGPFTMESYEKDESVELVANEDYWRGAPEVDGIRYVFYRNTDAAVRGLQAGEVDVVSGLTPAQYDTLARADDVETVAGSGRRYTALALNPGAIDAEGEPMGDGNPALADREVRRAIVTAIDKDRIVDVVLGGYGTAGETEVPTVYPDFYGFADDVDPVEFDIDEANRILDEAGYEEGPDGLRLDEQGDPLELRLMGNTDDANHVRMADFVQGWLDDIGIGVDQQLVSSDQVGTDSTLGNYDMYFTSWSLGPDPDFQLSINTCASRPNADGSGATSENNWCSPEFDDLYAEQHAELDPEARSALVKEAFSTLWEAHVNLPIYYADTLEAYRSDRFDGFIRQPEGEGPILGQNGYWGLYGATPASADGGDGGGLSTGVVVGIGAAVAILGAAGVLLVVRRRGGDDDRE